VQVCKGMFMGVGIGYGNLVRLFFSRDKLPNGNLAEQARF